MRKVQIVGTGMSVPERVVPNQYFNEVLGEDVDTWLKENVEIYERRWLPENQGVATLCVEAAKQAMERSSLGPDDFQLLIIATDTPEFVSPSTASAVQHFLGLSNCATFDVNTACAGFVSALDTAAKYFDAGQKDWFRSISTPSLTLYAKPRQIRENFAINFHRLPKEAEFMIEDRIAMRSAEDFPGYAHIVAQSIKAMVDRPLLDYLHLIKQPTLIIFGTEDQLIPNRFLTGGKTEDIAHQGHSRIPNSQLVMLDEAGHFVQFEASKRFNQAVLQFLEE